MNSELPLKATGTALDHILTSAVILNWSALGGQPEPVTVRLEYHVGQSGSVENLRLWVRGREYWSLICDYTPNVGWSDGPRFANGFHSRYLGRLFQSILMNQNLFRIERGPNTNAMIEILTPTTEQLELANERVNEAFPKPTKPTAPRLATTQTALAPGKA